MLIRRSELYRLRGILEARPRGPHAKFNYALGKNLRKIKEEIQDLEDAVTPDKEFNEYEKERIALNEECAKKEGGVSVFIPNPDGTRRYQIDESKQESFNKKLELLRKKYKATLDLQEKKIQGYNDMMREKAEINFHLINKEDIPDDLSPSDWEAIIDWVIEESGPDKHENPKGKK
jgi:Mor family transcriptional regulator